MEFNTNDPLSTIWITGASSGIGYALTAKLLEQRNTVIATARHINKLQDLQLRYKDTLFCFELDVTQEHSVIEFCAILAKKFIHIDNIILNAGICEYIEWPNLNLKIMHNNMNTNFWGAVNCLVHGLKLLEGSRSPYIVAVSSAAQIVGLPRAEGYGASKAALHYLLQSLQVELFKSKIKLSIVTPGFVNTELTAKNDFKMPLLISVETAANIILRGMRKRKTEIKFPFLLILVLNILSIMPDSLRNFILHKTIRRK